MIMKQEIRGELSLVLSCLFFAAMAIFVKMAAAEFSGMFISAFRFASGLIIGGAFLALSKTPLKLAKKKILLVRGALGMSAMLMYYTAIQMTGSGRATLLLNTFPIFVAIFGALFFRQAINADKIFSIILCLSGVIFVFYDGSSYGVLGTGIGLAAGIIRGLVVHFIKKSAEANHPLVVYLVVCLYGLLLLPFSAHEATKVDTGALILLLVVSIFSLIAQFLMTYGYRHVEALKGSLISYLTIPLTVLLGYFMGEELHAKFFVGLGLIAIGLLVNAGVHRKLHIRA